MASGMNIYGLQEAAAANQKIIAALKPSGAYGRAIKKLVTGGHAYAVRITHVDSGGLKSAHHMEVGGLDGKIFLRHGSGPSGDPAEYGPYEHRRGGSHAFYQRVLDEAGNRLGGEAVRELRRGMP